MTRRLRLGATALALLIPALVLARWSASGSLAPVEIAAPTLPRQQGQWTADADAELPADVLEVIEPDAYLLRRYLAEGAPLWLYLGVYAGRAGTGKAAHDPEVCYPAQGWEILDSRHFEVPLAGGEMLHAKLMTAQNGLEEEVILYWFQSAGRWPAGGALEELLRVFDAVRGRPQYAFARISMPLTDDTDEVAALVAFAAAIAPSIRSVVDSVRPASLPTIAYLDRSDLAPAR